MAFAVFKAFQFMCKSAYYSLQNIFHFSVYSCKLFWIKTVMKWRHSSHISLSQWDAIFKPNCRIYGIMSVFYPLTSWIKCKWTKMLCRLRYPEFHHTKFQKYFVLYSWDCFTFGSCSTSDMTAACTESGVSNSLWQSDTFANIQAENPMQARHR